ncbi:MAG: hypothetical protein P1V97_29845, partial [Planctomycetota bacterium]|nr:hypothetical protein [Planctomycetota bacterium]
REGKRLVERNQGMVNSTAPRCPYCHDSVTVHSTKQACEACMAWHHKECWQEHGGCSACGFKSKASTSSMAGNRRSAGGSERTASATKSPITTTCDHRDCDNRTQSVVAVPAYKKRCMVHAQEFGRAKVRNYNRLIAFFAFLTFIVVFASLIPGPLNDDVIGVLVFELFYGLVFVSIPASERRGHKRYVEKMVKNEDKSK